MDNPLARLLDVEDRSDGVYIKVTKVDKEGLSIESIRKCLDDAYIINYNLEAINEVFMRARGVLERIGAPFEYYNSKFDGYFTVSTTPLKATMNISSESIIAEIKLTVPLIVHALKRKGVVFGIREDIIKQAVLNSAYDTDIVVAEGQPPEKGVDAFIDIEIKINPDSTPAIDQNGRCDYRNIQSFSAVKTGQVLARRTPPCEGKPGISVAGKPIESEKGVDVSLPCGRNTKASEDNLTLTSQNDGIVFMQNNLIHVGELLNIPGDVNFAVGNIKYSGDIMIRGNVRPGFTIETEGDIEIVGEVESAKIISRKGNVTIGKGVIGKGEAEIFGEQSVTVNFAQECKIKTEGTLTVDKYLLNCDAICDHFESDKPNSSVIGGNLIVYKHADAMNLGNEKNVETNVSLVDKNRTKLLEKMQELEELKKKISQQLEPISRQLKTKTAMLKRMGANAPQKAREEVKKWVESYNNLNMKAKYITKKEEEIKAKIISPTNTQGYIKVKKTAYPGVLLDLYGISHKKIQGKMTSKIFRIVEGSIQAEG